MSASLYERVGGQAWFDALVDRFYEGVETDPVLRPLYPEDLEPGKHHLALFLAQYWGGPGTYSEERGHPRLRMRHFPFPVGSLQRGRWLLHMTSAVEANTPEGEIREALLNYFTTASEHLLNQPS